MGEIMSVTAFFTNTNNQPGVLSVQGAASSVQGGINSGAELADPSRPALGRATFKMLLQQASTSETDGSIVDGADANILQQNTVITSDGAAESALQPSLYIQPENAAVPRTANLTLAPAKVGTAETSLAPKNTDLTLIPTATGVVESTLAPENQELPITPAKTVISSGTLIPAAGAEPAAQPAATGQNTATGQNNAVTVTPVTAQQPAQASAPYFESAIAQVQASGPAAVRAALGNGQVMPQLVAAASSTAGTVLTAMLPASANGTAPTSANGNKTVSAASTALKGVSLNNAQVPSGILNTPAIALPGTETIDLESGEFLDAMEEGAVSGNNRLPAKAGGGTSVQQVTANTQLAASRIGAEAVSKFAARLASRAAGGASKFEMRLDPPQLGRIEVKMQVSADNRVHAILTTENPEVMQDLQRSADSLRRALIQEGFDLGSNDLEFQMEQQGYQHNNPDAQQEQSPNSQLAAKLLGEAVNQAQAEIDTGNGYWLLPDQRIDIRA